MTMGSCTCFAITLLRLPGEVVMALEGAYAELRGVSSVREVSTVWWLRGEVQARSLQRPGDRAPGQLQGINKGTMIVS
jgi:hypothetical protein